LIHCRNTTITYFAPPLALLNHEQTSWEKQSCVYAFPSATPEQPAPQRPLQLYLQQIS
jgi:hypothetical protein